MDDRSSPRTLSTTALNKLKHAEIAAREAGRHQALLDSPSRLSLVKFFQSEGPQSP